MIFRTIDNQAIRFDRPSPEALARETHGQVSAMWQLCQVLGGQDGIIHPALAPVRIRRETSLGRQLS